MNANVRSHFKENPDAHFLEILEQRASTEWILDKLSNENAECLIYLLILWVICLKWFELQLLTHCPSISQAISLSSVSAKNFFFLFKGKGLATCYVAQAGL